MCTVLLPPGVNPIAVNKYIDININYVATVQPKHCTVLTQYILDTLWLIHVFIKLQAVTFRNTALSNKKQLRNHKLLTITCRKFNENNHRYGRRKAQNFLSSNSGNLPDLIPLDEFEESRQKADNSICTSNLVTMRIAQTAQCLVYRRNIDIS
jgi:hypothetical protein